MCSDCGGEQSVTLDPGPTGPRPTFGQANFLFIPVPLSILGNTTSLSGQTLTLTIHWADEKWIFVGYGSHVPLLRFDTNFEGGFWQSGLPVKPGGDWAWMALPPF